MYATVGTWTLSGSACNACGYTTEFLYCEVYGAKGPIITISPNPTSGITTVKLVQTTDASKQLLATPVDQWTIEVYDTQLRQLWQQTKSNENTAVFNTHGWQPGIYTVIVRLEKEVLTGRLVVQ